MISADESDEEITVPWPPQPRRPLRPAMSSSASPHGYNLRRSSRRSSESGVPAEDAADDDARSQSDLDDSEDESRGLQRGETARRNSGRFSGRRPEKETPGKKGDCNDGGAGTTSSDVGLLAVAVGIFIAVCFGLGLYVSNTGDDGDVTNLPGIHTHLEDNVFEKYLKDQIRAVKKHYPTQRKDLWPELLAGIKRVARVVPPQPTTFLLLHTGEAEDTLRCLAREVARAATGFLNASQFVAVDGERLREIHERNLRASKEPEDNGWFVEMYRPLVERDRAMILYDLEKVPGMVAQALHSFCDEVSPLVGQAVYLFTLRVPEYSSLRAVRVAEDLLNDLWSGELSDDVRAPLLTRITGGAVYVLPEPELPRSCS
ncbi:uncharacterized protein LOC134539513 [Bacillus rossius redtenbacheri]|uniref:uncharacterized protein LOC134539513 n=1 Tax=Bacillus rossius redtenbacheri TaxID=93214 RepID=UPI002FDC82DF